MSGNVLPAAAPPIVAGLPNWFARASKTAESGFDNATICFWGDSTTATCLNWFKAGPLPVTVPTANAARFVNFHQKPGEALAGTRILNFGNAGATLAAALSEPSAAVFNITRVLAANQQITWPAASPPVAGDTVTIGGVVFTFVSSGATGNQVNIGADFGTTISNLQAVLNASTDPTVSKNKYAARSSNYDVSYALDIWSKVPGPAGAGMSVACSTAGAQINGTPVLQVPGLIVLCFGINDVRTGATTQAQLVALIRKAVDRIRAVLPQTDIVLWGPNSFLQDDVGAAGYILPNTAAAAQSYSTLLYGAYEQLQNRWPNVLVLQKQDIFGKTSMSYAALGGSSSTSFMADQLHPSLTAQTQMADWLAPLVGFKKPFNPQRAALARISNPAAPYAVYPREVEDPSFYDMVGQGAWVGQGNVSGNDYMDFYFPGPRYKEILPGDIVQMGTGGAVFQMPLTGVTLYNLNATTTRLGFTGTGLLPSFSGGTVTVYRHKYEWDATIQSYAQQANAYPYRRRFYVAAAGAGFMRLYPLAQNSRDPANMLLNPATDVVVPPGGFGAVTGYSVLAFQAVGAWQVQKTGTDFSSLVGKYVWVFSTFPQREYMENNFEPIRFNAPGSIANSTYARQIAVCGAGKVNKVSYTQGTAGTTDMTITLKIAGTLVLTLLVTANHVGIQTTTWATGSSFAVFPNQLIEWNVSGGTGAADIAIALDIGG